MREINKRIIEKRIQGKREHQKRKPKSSKWSDLSPKQKTIRILLLSLMGSCLICLPIISSFSGDVDGTVANDIESQDEQPSVESLATISSPEIVEAIRERLLNLSEVSSVTILDVRTDSNDNVLIYSEILLEDYRTDKRAVANDLLEWISFETRGMQISDVSFIIDDRFNAVSFIYDTTANGWIIDTLDSFNTTRAANATPTYTPRPRPTRAPAVNNSGNSGNTSSRRPENCPDARAMGLSAREAAQWDHLDRDNDGVACYGD
ncbi:MAG: excalibur calcium-binding domain-containing protein [Anaerolineae bacterium]